MLSPSSPNTVPSMSSTISTTTLRATDSLLLRGGPDDPTGSTGGKECSAAVGSRSTYREVARGPQHSWTHRRRSDDCEVRAVQGHRRTVSVSPEGCERRNHRGQSGLHIEGGGPERD